MQPDARDVVAVEIAMDVLAACDYKFELDAV